MIGRCMKKWPSKTQNVEEGSQADAEVAVGISGVEVVLDVAEKATGRGVFDGVTDSVGEESTNKEEGIKED